jgi:hypothetical protein
VTVDFHRLVRNRTPVPRHLFFLVDQDGKFRYHPDPKKIGTSIVAGSTRRADAGRSADPGRAPRLRQEAERVLERTGGECATCLSLRLGYWHAKKPLDTEFVKTTGRAQAGAEAATPIRRCRSRSRAMPHA